jgi:hypothetical protein
VQSSFCAVASNCLLGHDFRYNSLNEESRSMQSLFLLSEPPVALPDAKILGGSLIFASVSPRRPTRWPSFLISVLFHVLVVLLLPPLTVHLVEESDRELLIRQERMLRTLRIRVPEQLYVASSGSDNVPKKKLAVRYRPPGTSRTAGPAGPAESTRKSPPRRRRFELPPLPRRSEMAQIILQPQFAPDLMPAAAIRLPEVFFWAPRTAPPNFVAPFVTPGHATPPTQARLLDTPPRLELPASAPAPLNVTGPPSLTAALRIPPPLALPIRTSEAEKRAPRTGASADSIPGDPTAVLSLAIDAERMREFLSVPPGNQVGRLPEASSSGPAALTGSSGNGGGGEAGSERAAAREAAKPLPEAERRAAEQRKLAAANQPPAPEESAVPTAAQTATTMRSMALAAAAATRVVHPSSGVFDVVVESAGAAGFQESAGVLSGKPVYSAYIQAGGSKDWLLQYCIPAGEDAPVEVSGLVVRLGSGSPLTAPYPLVTMRPPVRPRPGQHVMVHGFVSTAGRLLDLRVLGNAETWEAEMVLAVLEQWEFRPAHRDGKAVRVEVLLAIPAE